MRMLLYESSWQPVQMAKLVALVLPSPWHLQAQPKANPSKAVLSLGSRHKLTGLHVGHWCVLVAGNSATATVS